MFSIQPIPVKKVAVIKDPLYGVRPVEGDQCWVAPECSPYDRPPKLNWHKKSIQSDRLTRTIFGCEPNILARSKFTVILGPAGKQAVMKVKQLEVQIFAEFSVEILMRSERV
jgi:hypothetical protein